MFYIRAMNNLRIFLALILIFIFYRLFNIHDKINDNSTIENFTDDNVKTEINNIQLYLNRRITNFNLQLSEIKIIYNKELNIYKADNPIIIDNDLEVDSAKIQSDSPVFVPANLYIDGPFKIKNYDKGSEISKNLIIGNAKLSERDLGYLTNYILPFYIKNEDESIRRVCVENPDNLKNYVVLDDLDEMEIPQGLTFKGQVNRMLQVVREYDFNLEDERFNLDLIKTKTYQIDYNLFNLIKAYPRLIHFLRPGLRGLFKRKRINPLENIDNEYVFPAPNGEYLKKYFYENKPLKFYILKFRIRTSKERTKRRDFKLVNKRKFGIQRFKFDGSYFKNGIIETSVKKFGLRSIFDGSKTKELCEDIMKQCLSEYNKYKNIINNRFDSLTRSECLNSSELKFLSGEKSLRLSSKDAERVDTTPWAGNPYLKDYELKIHSANHDDNDDCTANSKIKTSYLTNDWKTGEVSHNGNFTIEPSIPDWPQYDTNILCAPTN